MVHLDECSTDDGTLRENYQLKISEDRGVKFRSVSRTLFSIFDQHIVQLIFLTFSVINC